MALKQITTTAAIALALALAGCSSNKSDDSGKNTNQQSAPVSSGSSYDPNAGANDLAGLQRVVYFDFDKSDLSPAAQSILDSNIAALRNGTKSIRLEGHADERGTREYNLALGERRANAVAKYLQVNGIASSRIETISYGKEKPADAGHDESAWAKNRRVEIVLN
jgi:peptidoglycan-associated lipoprotein